MDNTFLDNTFLKKDESRFWAIFIGNIMVIGIDFAHAGIYADGIYAGIAQSESFLVTFISLMVWQSALYLSLDSCTTESSGLQI